MTDDEKVIEKAREQYANDNLNIDDGAAVTITPDGCWVGAWVFVEHEEE